MWKRQIVFGRGTNRHSHINSAFHFFMAHEFTQIKIESPLLIMMEKGWILLYLRTDGMHENMIQSDMFMNAGDFHEFLLGKISANDSAGWYTTHQLPDVTKLKSMTPRDSVFLAGNDQDGVFIWYTCVSIRANPNPPALPASSIIFQSQ